MKAMISATINTATSRWLGACCLLFTSALTPPLSVASERSKLQQAAEYLEQNSEHSLLVEGHCDWHGTSEYNLVLGDRRANSIGDYLDTLGITPERIEKLSKGSLEATSGLSRELSSQNRRADLIVLKK